MALVSPSPCPGSTGSLQAWLHYLEHMHRHPIEMGLERVQAVRTRLGLQLPGVVFAVAGTNGKGSTCAMLASVLQQAGYRVGLYTSPHLLHFTERARVNGQNVPEEALVQAFVAVEAARIQLQPCPTLTYFEFTTLAVAWWFAQQPLDAVVLEVGMGGRLDAVNIFDADCAICTSVDLDHMAFLGPNREAIGHEKAGIFRAGRPAIVSDPMPPQSVLDHAKAIGADLWLLGRDFNYSADKQQWGYGGRALRRASLAYPALRGANQLLNACAVLAALEAMHLRLPVPAQALRQGLLWVEWPGRCQVLPGQPSVVLDVGHNPHAAAHLRASLAQMGYARYTHCICGMLADKDALGVVQALQGVVDHWHLVPTEGERGRSAEQLLSVLCQAGVQAEPFAWQQLALASAVPAASSAIPSAIPSTALAANSMKAPERSMQTYPSVAQALSVLTQVVPDNDRIVVFGSFAIVGEAYSVLRCR